MKPVCVPCQRFFRVKKNGFCFIEAMPIGRDIPPGKEAPDCWTPYKAWSGDLWECNGCGAQIVSGVGREPLAEHYQERFGEVIAVHNADQLQVNDC